MNEKIILDTRDSDKIFQANKTKLMEEKLKNYFFQRNANQEEEEFQEAVCKS